MGDVAHKIPSYCGDSISGMTSPASEATSLLLEEFIIEARNAAATAEVIERNPQALSAAILANGRQRAANPVCASAGNVPGTVRAIRLGQPGDTRARFGADGALGGGRDRSLCRGGSHRLGLRGCELPPHRQSSACWRRFTLPYSRRKTSCHNFATCFARMYWTAKV